MPGYPCCCTGCDIASDEFNRVTLGSGWTQVAGTWAISTNRLETSDADALAIYATDHPDGSSSHHISVLGQVSDTGSKIRGVVAYDSADDYIFVELTIDSAGCSDVKFFQRSGGTTSQIGAARVFATLATGTDYRMEVCFQEDDGELCVKISLEDGSHSWTFCSDSTITASGDQVGLGTGTLTSSGSASFDSFAWNVSKNDQGSCPDCKGSTCLLMSDNFTRSDSSDLGCQWTETSGAWSIVFNELVTSSSSAQVTTTMTNFRPGYDIVGGTFRFGTSHLDATAVGDVIRIMVDVDGADSHALQITAGSFTPGSATVELLKGTTVLKTVSWTIWPGVDWNFAVCFQGDYIEADIHYIDATGVKGRLHLDALTTPYGGDRTAMGTGPSNNSSVQFDYWSWTRAKNSDDMDCPDCVDISGDTDPPGRSPGCSNCLDDDAPGSLKVVVSGFSAGEWPCDINGTYILPVRGSEDADTVDGNPFDDGTYGCCYSQIETLKLYPPDPDADPPHNGNSCTFYTLAVCIVHDDEGYSIRGTLGIDSQWGGLFGCPCETDSTYWFRRFPTKIDCLNLAGMSIPFEGTHLTSPHRFVRPCDNDDYAECGFSGAALVVTSL